MRAVQKSIEQLYRAFATTPRPRKIDGCPCCFTDEEIAVVLGKDLREIAPDEIASYASSAFLTVGAKGDYLYFLPRILEITATEVGWWPDAAVTGRAIRDAEPDSWSDAQRGTLKQYLEAVIESSIASERYHDLDDWMCAIGRMEFDVQPYLRQIEKSPAAVLDYFEHNAETLHQGRLLNPFWEPPNEAHDAVVNWFFSPEIAKIPYDAYGYVLTRAD